MRNHFVEEEVIIIVVRSGQSERVSADDCVCTCQGYPRPLITECLNDQQHLKIQIWLQINSGFLSRPVIFRVQVSTGRLGMF